MPRKKLTHQQKKFVEAMANPKTKNQTQAAIAAGCPPNSARVQASKWLTKANISEAIEHRKQRAILHSRITPDEVLGSAAFNMRSSMDDLLDDSGTFSLEKARETGAIDIVKKLKETITTNRKGETIKVLELELLSSADARKEVANYMGFGQRTMFVVDETVQKWKQAVLQLIESKTARDAPEAVALLKHAGFNPPGEQAEREIIRQSEAYRQAGQA
jgi:phage terminase small subunit